MRIEIFNVEHGQCAMIHCPPLGKKLMIDTGHNGSTGWRPSQHFRGQQIETLIHTNYDEDHASDLVGVKQNCAINGIIHNRTIGSRQLYAMKAECGMGPGVQNIHNWLQWVERQQPGSTVNMDLGQVTRRSYWNSYGTGAGQFTDANNLSVATFVTYAGFTILFPGDLEVAGWRQLIQQPGFLADLYRTTVLVASHHGRENGCCDELFAYWNPYATIISDAGIEHATQQTVNWYATRTLGCRTRAGADRKVFTTRSDGKITIDVDAQGTWYISTATSTPFSALSALLMS